MNAGMLTSIGSGKLEMQIGSLRELVHADKHIRRPLIRVTNTIENALDPPRLPDVIVLPRGDVPDDAEYMILDDVSILLPPLRHIRVVSDT